MGAEERPPEEPSAEAIGLGTTSPTFAHDGPEAEPAATTAAAGGDATRRTRGRTGTKRSRRRRQRSPLPDRWRRHGAAPARGGSTDFTTHAAPSQRRPTRPSGQRRAAVRPGLVRDRRHEGGPAHLSPPGQTAIGGQTARSGRYRGQVLVNGSTREVGGRSAWMSRWGCSMQGGPCTARTATGTPTSSGDAVAE